MAAVARQDLGIRVHMANVASTLEMAVSNMLSNGIPVTNLTQVIANAKNSFGQLSLSNNYVPEANELLFNPDIRLWTNPSPDQVEIVIVNAFPLGPVDARYYHGMLANGMPTNVAGLPLNYVRLESSQ